MNNGTIIRIKDALASANGNSKAVEVEALLTSVTSSTAKNGKPYVDGILIDGPTKVVFRHWDIEESTFYSKYKLPAGKSVVVQVSGNLEFFNDTPQIVVKGGVTLVEREGAIDNYIDVAPYPVGSMLGTLNREVGKIAVEPLKKVCEEFLANPVVSAKIGYCPFSTEVHSEKAGWLHHIYNLLALTSSGIGEPKVKSIEDNNVVYKPLLDKDVILTAIVTYNMSSFFLLDVDADTGIIESYNDSQEILFGGLLGLKNITNIFPKIDRYFPGADAELANQLNNVKHCIAVLNSSVAPATPESFYLYHLQKLELTAYASANVCRSIEENEVARYSLNGKTQKVVKL